MLKSLKIKRYTILSFCLLTMLSTLTNSCVVGPNYTPPNTEVPEEWHDPEPVETPSATPDMEPLIILSDEPPDTSWWEIFEDPLLNNYICLAAEYNKDIQIAIANVRQARAARQLAASHFFPQITNDINATRQAFSKNGPLFNIPNGLTPNQMITPTIPRLQNIFNFLFDAIWEIDLFGKTARNVEAADARIGSSLEALNDTLLSIFAEIARNYVEVRTAQHRMLLIEKNIELLHHNAEVSEKRFRAGLANSLDVDRILAEEAQLRSTLPRSLADVYSGIYNLSVLTGHLPEALLAQMLPVEPLPKMPFNIAVGIRSEVLRRRPDVREAERELAAATADIGVAVAAFYPSFTLTGEIGLQSVALANLFSGKSLLWSYGADLNTPLFTGWRLEADLETNKAKARQASLQYEKIVLTAIQEAEKNMVLVVQDMAAVKDLEESVRRSRKVVGLTNQRYTQGAIAVIDLLDTERTLISAEENLLNSQANALIDLIALYKALGGGWRACDEI